MNCRYVQMTPHRVIRHTSDVQADARCVDGDPVARVEEISLGLCLSRLQGAGDGDKPAENVDVWSRHCIRKSKQDAQDWVSPTVLAAVDLDASLHHCRRRSAKCPYCPAETSQSAAQRLYF